MVREVQLRLAFLLSHILTFTLLTQLPFVAYGQNQISSTNQGSAGIPLGGGGPPVGAPTPPSDEPEATDSGLTNPQEPATPGKDLLSQYDKTNSSKPAWMSKLLGLLGAGGAPIKQAEKAYTEGDYDKALQKFAEAQLDQPESQALAYDIGNAHFRKKKYDEAIVSYKKALNGDNATLAAKAYYNLGNAEFRKGEFAIQSGHQEGIEDYREAMAHYKKSLEVTPDNKDAKRNIEVVQARIKELLDRQKQKQDQQGGDPQKPPEPSEKAKEVMARALQLVQERRYGEARSLLEDIIQKDATAATFQGVVQKIDDVQKILRGEAPTPPQSQDPRSSQPGVGVI
jgi:tetratricopeptide (TPR) repeat protein